MGTVQDDLRFSQLADPLSDIRATSICDTEVWGDRRDASSLLCDTALGKVGRAGEVREKISAHLPHSRISPQLVLIVGYSRTTTKDAKMSRKQILDEIRRIQGGIAIDQEAHIRTKFITVFEGTIVCISYDIFIKYCNPFLGGSV